MIHMVSIFLLVKICLVRLILHWFVFCSSHRTPTSERQSKGKQFEAEAMRNAHGLEVPGSAGSSRPVDGEQQQEMSRPKNSDSQKNHAGNGNGSERLSQSHVLHKTRSTDYDPDKKKITIACSLCMHFGSLPAWFSKYTK